MFKRIYKTTFWATLIGVCIFILDFGFSQSERFQEYLNLFYFVILIFGIISTSARYIEKKSLIRIKKAFVFDLLSVLFTLFLFYVHFFDKNEALHPITSHPIWVKLAVVLSFIRELSAVKLNYRSTNLNPAQLFIISFLIIILIGAFALMLPQATHDGISFIDALFTSTSAVCVTGLIVVDTSSYFTETGQLIIIALIQIGGLGILTFASYFSYFFKGGTSYENQLTLSDINNSQKLGKIFSVLKYVLLITFTVEAFSSFLIYSSIDSRYFASQYDQVFFSIFHAISAFCNAGFSTLSNNLYETGFKFNYYLQLVIILTFVLGGLGFPIVVNIINYIKYRIKKLILFKRVKHQPWILNLNSRITLITTLSISAVAFLLFFILEYNNTLAEHHFLGKIVTALFGATTPRTAGFNTIDITAMLFPTTAMILVLMWIGASPFSTGGGIKTSTFAIAFLNILSLARGKTRIEVFRREVADISVKRAFAIIFLSLIVIGLGIIFLTISEKNKDLMSIAFECFSAYSTVGLSMNLTSSLSSVGKFIIIAIMFIGRVSVLTLVIALFKKIKHKNYRYPTEEITIN